MSDSFDDMLSLIINWRKCVLIKSIDQLNAIVLNNILMANTLLEWNEHFVRGVNSEFRYDKWFLQLYQTVFSGRIY